MRKVIFLFAVVALVSNPAWADQEIRDRNNRLLGTIRQVGTRFEARDPQGRLKGTYDPKMNVTRDPVYRVVGKGNLLSALIMQR